MRLALSLIWFFGATAIGAAVVWQCYQALTMIVGFWRATVVLTVLALVFGIAWICAITEYPYSIEALDRTVLNHNNNKGH